MISRKVRHAAGGCFLSLGLAALIYAGHGDAWTGFWRYDDPAVLNYANGYRIADYFFNPASLWRFESFNINPMLAVSFLLDSMLFGLEPRFFYWHQLLGIWLASLATVLLLYRWVEPCWAWLGGALWILGSPVAIVSHQLMCRHYLEGLLFALLAIYFYQESVVRKRYQESILAAFFYFLAVSYKEIYVPLVVLLPFLNSGSFHEKGRRLVPVLTVLALYVPWRFFMLGSILGGMGLEIDYARALSLLLSTWEYFFGTLAIPVLLLFLSFLVILVLRFPQHIPAVVLTAGALYAPLLPIAGIIGEVDRYFFGVWWAAVAALCVGLSRLSLLFPKSHWLAAALFLLAGFGAGHKFDQTRKRWAPLHAEFDVQGRFLWSSSGQETIWLSPRLSRNYWYVHELFQMKKEESPDFMAGPACLDESDLLPILEERAPLWVYDPAAGAMKRGEEEARLKYADWKSRLEDRRLSLNLRFDASEGWIEWEAGPYREGRYLFLTGRGFWELPPRGRLRNRSPDDFDVRLRYDSPQGWITYSDRLRISPLSEPAVRWHRP